MKLRSAIRKERPADDVLIYDNATPHKSNTIKTAIGRYNWEMLLPPTYSPDLRPYDFDVFPKLKVKFRGVRFEYLAELKYAVAMQFHRLTLG